MKNSLTSSIKLLPSWLGELWPILSGLVVLYLPTYFDLFSGIWGQGGDQAHGPIVLIVVLYLFWQNRHILTSQSPTVSCPRLGAIFLVFGLILYVLGRSQAVIMLEIGSQIFVITGVLLITRGIPVIIAYWFPLFFIFFMIPLPGVFLGAVTMPMKMAVSYVAEHMLFWIGYPISRAGVILQIGQFQLLVADACAGMHTLISLEALGLLYLNLVKHNSLFRNIALALLIVPISFTANVIRVIVLTLVTYYFGDAAGQGFIHGFAGMVLFIVALSLIISVDGMLQFIAKRWFKPAESLQK